MASVSLNETLTNMYILWDRIDFMRFYVCLGNIYFFFKLYISYTEGTIERHMPYVIREIQWGSR